MTAAVIEGQWTYFRFALRTLLTPVMTIRTSSGATSVVPAEYAPDRL